MAWGGGCGCSAVWARRAVWAVFVLAGWSGYARGQTQPATRMIGDPSLPADVRAALARLEDYRFDFAQEGFFRLLAHVLERTEDLRGAATQEDLADWTALLERPVDFRGRVVTIAGEVGRSKRWRFRQAPWDGLGELLQVELTRNDTPVVCTVIMPGDAGPLPVGGVVRITGVFCLVRNYKTRGGGTQQAALLVAQGPSVVATRAAREGGAPAGIIIGGLCAGLVVVWVLLRRGLRRRAATVEAARAEAPENLADELTEWAAEDDSLARDPPRKRDVE